MNKNSIDRTAFLAILLLIAIISGACTANGGSSTTQVTLPDTYPVDAFFRDLYNSLGGQEILGPAISPMFGYETRRYQYLQNACLEYNPDLPRNEQFRLAPLGMELNVQEPAVPSPVEPSKVYVNGHVIFDNFTNLYRKFGGARYTGNPLTEAHYNAESDRFEQFFENVGFAWKVNDPPGNVYLLALGSWKCANGCQLPIANSIAVNRPIIPITEYTNYFTAAVSRLGPDLTGYALKEPYQIENDLVILVYASAVLATSASHPGDIEFLPLPGLIGIKSEQPILPNNMEGMIFWPTEGELGHNVPKAFVEFITLHGGTEISGSPITELFLINDHAFRQCFTNYCLDYYMIASIPESSRVLPSPLGNTYLEKYQQLETNIPPAKPDLSAISLQVWERFPFISSKQYQEIGASIYEGNRPLQKIEPTLTMVMPDGAEKTFYFPPTGADGQTSLRLDPIKAGNGTLIPYQVCISSITNERFCVKDSFVIWFNP